MIRVKGPNFSLLIIEVKFILAIKNMDQIGIGIPKRGPYLQGEMFKFVLETTKWSRLTLNFVI